MPERSQSVLSHPNPPQLREWLEAFGTSTHSFLSLYPNLRYFTLKHLPGYIPYVDCGQLILGGADPICDPSDTATFIDRFRLFCGERMLGFVPANEHTKLATQQLGFDNVYIGREPIFDLKTPSANKSSIRQAINRAKRKGFQVIPFENRYEAALQALCGNWLGSREMPPMAFLFQLRPLELKENKRIFLLVDEMEHLHAFLACSPIYARNGWYLEDLIREPELVNGCTELLVCTAMELLANEGAEMASLALAPLAGLPHQDAQHPHLNQLLRMCYQHLSFIYRFQTLEYFKGKFQPSHWEDNYFCFYPKGVSFRLISNLLRAFMPQDLPQIIQYKLQRLRFKFKNEGRV